MSRLTYLLFAVFFAVLIVVGCMDEPKSDSKDSADPTANFKKNPFLTETLEELQGIWIDTENENRSIRITKNVYREKSPGAEENVMEIEAYLHCPNYCNDGRTNVSMYSCFILKKNNTAECFAVMRLADGELQFTAMAGKPKVEIFRKE